MAPPIHRSHAHWALAALIALLAAGVVLVVALPGGTDDNADPDLATAMVLVPMPHAFAPEAPRLVGPAEPLLPEGPVALGLSALAQPRSDPGKPSLSLSAPRIDRPAQPNAVRRATEAELIRALITAPEVGLGLAAPVVLRGYARAAGDNARLGAGPNLSDPTPLVTARVDLATLPLQTGPRARIGARAAGELELLSRKLRLYLNALSPVGADGRRTAPERLREALQKDKRGKRPEWLRAAAVPTMVQMLMHEESPLRRTLVDLLAEVPERPATLALAQRAVFDLDASVRRAATDALKKRDPELVRPVLLRALRYPWAEPAKNAAEALIVLGDRKAVPHLVNLLDRPDPSLPQALRNGRLVVQELVRIDHVRNCLMCHPPAVTPAEPCLGVDPVLSIPGPPAPAGSGAAVAAGGAQLSASAGGHNYGNRPTSSTTAPTRPQVTRVNGRPVIVPVRAPLTPTQVPLLLRGDITFLRQDFSVQLPVRGLPPGPGVRLPPGQRFDFVVRTRALTSKERIAWKKAPAPPPTYPQREAVLHALRRLTGKSPSDKTADWVALFPRAATDGKAERLANRLVDANPLLREGLLRQHRQSDGEEHTRALARAAARLSGPARDAVRAALVERLERLPSDEVWPLFDDKDAEIQRAAGIAWADIRETVHRGP